jgi:hypothetical protein
MARKSNGDSELARCGPQVTCYQGFAGPSGRKNGGGSRHSPYFLVTGGEIGFPDAEGAFVHFRLG